MVSRVPSGVTDRDEVVLVDLPCFGRPTRAVPAQFPTALPRGPDCESVDLESLRIAFSRQVMTDRVGRWATWQVGKQSRAVAHVARELGCDWHTVNDIVLTYGRALLDVPDRLGEVIALGLDETLSCRWGRLAPQGVLHLDR